MTYPGGHATVSAMNEHFVLTATSLEDGLDILEMLHDIGPGENGLTNASYDLDPNAWKDYLTHLMRYAEGAELPAERVPQTTYWLRRDGYPVGMSKVSHILNDELRARGGHIGYSLRPGERGKGLWSCPAQTHARAGTPLGSRPGAHHCGLGEYVLTLDDREARRCARGGRVGKLSVLGADVRASRVADASLGVRLDP